jgi:DNA-binding NarL/FixJ family response regulator
LAAGDQDGLRQGAELLQGLDDGESVAVGQHDIQQQDIGVQSSDRLHRGVCVDRLADHKEPCTVEQLARGGTERVVVIDDHNRAHDTMVTVGDCHGNRDSPTLSGTMRSVTSTRPLRVAIAEDSVLLRTGVARLLSDHSIDVVGETGDAAGLLRLVAQHRPDVAIVDIRMPPTNTDEGLVAADQIRTRWPDVGVLLLSQHLDSGYAFRLLELHPERVGYLLKDRVSDIMVLVDAIGRITAGECVVDPTIVSRLMHRPRVGDPIGALSPRERDVLALMAEGLSNKAVGDRLFLSTKTVESHTSRVFTKLGLLEDPDSHRRVRAVLAYLRPSADA